MDEVDRLLARVKHEAFGWMPLPVYRRLYDTAAARNGGAFVEIGTAQGAATIALALGAKAAGKPFRIYTVDDFVTGSRPRSGSPQEKLALVRRGYEAFGVADSIENVIGSTADFPTTAGLPEIALLLIDADGRIDRDLALLHGRLAPDCPVIVDDMDDAFYIYMRKGRLVIDQKHRLTHLLLAAFAGAGLLVPDGASGQTGWYRKGPASLPAAEIERLALPAYRELVFARLGAGDFGVKRAAYRLASWLPRAWSGFQSGESPDARKERDIKDLG